MPINENAPLSVTPGAIRFNTDSMKLEYYRGGPVGFGTTTTTGEWVNLTTDSPDIQTGGTRGVFGGGFDSPLASTNIIEYITISTTGNSQDFGDLTVNSTRAGGSGCSSSTRGLFISGGSPARNNSIEYVTISSTGNAADFGDISYVAFYLSACASSTRGISAGGSTSATPSGVNNIEYVTIASTGNAQDFGDLTRTSQTMSSCSSSTRGIFAGGYSPSPTLSNIIEFITFSSLGNAADFGDLTATIGYTNGGCSNSTRGLLTAGTGVTNTINYITISTLGNAQDFGDLTVARILAAACSSPTRGVWGGGQTPTRLNTIDYVTIMSTGNAIDFGDFTSSYSTFCSQASALSNGHGGLG